MADKILATIGEICKGAQPGKTVVQKLFYLMQRKGAQFGLDYGIHYFGPYCSELDQLIRGYAADDIIDIRLGSDRMTHEIHMNVDVPRVVCNPAEYAAIGEVIEKYSNSTAKHLELITTTDYVAKQLLSHMQLDKNSILQGVKKYKGDKFSDGEIINAIEHLQKEDLLSLVQ